jgi:hypothetical protein
VSYLNANIPPIYCKIRKEYLYDLDPKYNKDSEECVIFGIASIARSCALTISHIMLPNGAVYYRLPISAFFQKRFSRSEVPGYVSSTQLQLWNCFSYYPAVTYFEFFSRWTVVENFSEKTKKNTHGTYLFTMWTGD